MPPSSRLRYSSSMPVLGRTREWALDTHSVSSALGKEYHSNLNAMTKHIGYWMISGPQGRSRERCQWTSQREVVNPLSRSGTSSSNIQFTSQRHCDYWNQTEGIRHSKLKLRKPSSGYCLSSLKNREARLFTRLSVLRKHLRTMGIYEGDPICKLYGGDDETATHIIFSCEALITRRIALKRQPGVKYQSRSYWSEARD